MITSPIIVETLIPLNRLIVSGGTLAITLSIPPAKLSEKGIAKNIPSTIKNT